MLDKLDDIPWSSLRHAYGSAHDVPRQLRDLLSEDAEVSEHALSERFTNIWHQGTVYEATAYAVPFLLEIAENHAAHHRVYVVDLLAALARGSSYLDVHVIQHPGPTSVAMRTRPDFDTKLHRELGWVKATRDAVREGVPRFLELLNDADSEMVFAAANVLSCFPDAAEAIIPPIQQQWVSSPDVVMRAAMLRTLPRLNGERQDTQALLVAIMSDEDAPSLLRFTATVQLVFSHPALCTAEGIEFLQEVAEAKRSDIRRWIDWYSHISRETDSVDSSAQEAAEYALELLERHAEAQEEE